MTESKIKEIRDMLQAWQKENSEHISRIDFSPHAESGSIRVFALARKRLIDDTLLLRFSEAAKYFREKTGYEVWFEVRVYFHAK